MTNFNFQELEDPVDTFQKAPSGILDQPKVDIDAFMRSDSAAPKIDVDAF